jgi:putative heme-binding domain-containing protein
MRSNRHVLAPVDSDVAAYAGGTPRWIGIVLRSIRRGISRCATPFAPGGSPGAKTVSVALFVVLWTTMAFAQRDLKDIPPPDPELERQTLQLADGLEINLYAADPLLAKPIQMNFDAQGRLWVATSEVYPQIEPGKTANDKIIVLEDADRDGRADRTHVFADGLLIPTGIEPGDGGAYVANSTELLHFADTDGDLKADARRTLLSGFGTEDTHHILHTLRWGPDARLYMNQSIYIHSHIETPYGVRRLGGGGIWQFDPRTHRLEIFARGWINPWGHIFDRWGNSFVTDGAGGEGINYAFPGAVYPTAPGAPRVLHGMNPGTPKYCGLEMIAGRHWPDDWQGNVITCDFRAHRIVRYKLAEQGSGYSSREQPEVVKSNHVAFRPIDLRLGPDGALYVADWYNPIIQHGEVDFRDPRRDHTHGRIWRITVKGRELAPRTDFKQATDAELFAMLKAPEDFLRQHARRELASRPIVESADGMKKLIGDASGADDANATVRLDALRLFQSHGLLAAPQLQSAASSQQASLRAAAMRLAGDQIAAPNVLAVVAPRAVDEHPQVRLEAICALQQSPTFAAVAAALQALEKPLDENLDFALWQLCRERKDVWLPDVVAGKSPLFEHPEQLEFALRAVDDPVIVGPVLKLLDGGRVAAERRDGMLTLVARLGGPPELTMIFERVVDQATSDVVVRRSLMTALAEAAVTRKVRPGGDLNALVPLLASYDDATAAAAARLLGLWKIEAARERLTQLARQAEPTQSRHLAAIDALAELGGPASQRTLVDLAAPDRSVAVRGAAATGLLRVDVVAAARAAVDLFKSASNDAAELDVAAIIEAFAARPPAAVALRQALSQAKLPTDVAKLAVRTARSSAKPDDALIEALRTAGGLTGTAWKLSPEEVQTLVAQVKERGDPRRGEALFHRKDLACTKCHAIGGAGGRVGPDLVSIGASAQPDYLVDSMLDPNKAIKEGFHAVVVALDDGRTLNGIKVRETDKDLILRDAEDREVVVPRKSIEEQAQGKSLMPVGLVENLTRDELIDLVRFLGELGKVGSYQLPQARFVRRWETLVPTKDVLELVRRNRVGVAATNDPRLAWEPVYARVDGTLPLDGRPSLQGVENKFMSIPPYTVVRFEFDVAAAGEAELAIDDAAHLQAWLDGRSLEVAPRIRFAAVPGRHIVTLVVDRARRTGPLRCEFVDVPNSSAIVTPVAAK